jgi:hypothetical protein
MAIELLELHYHLRDNSHAMSAVIRNRSEAEALAVCLHIAAELGIPLQLESSAFTEGGLREIWQFIGQNNTQLTLLLAVIVLVLSRIPVSDPEMDTLNKQVARATIGPTHPSTRTLRDEAAQRRLCQTLDLLLVKVICSTKHRDPDAQPIHQHGRCAMKPRSAGYVRRWFSPYLRMVFCMVQ